MPTLVRRFLILLLACVCFVVEDSTEHRFLLPNWLNQHFRRRSLSLPDIIPLFFPPLISFFLSVCIFFVWLCLGIFVSYFCWLTFRYFFQNSFSNSRFIENTLRDSVYWFMDTYGGLYRRRAVLLYIFGLCMCTDCLYVVGHSWWMELYCLWP